MRIIMVIVVFIGFSFVATVSMTRPTISVEVSTTIEELRNLATYIEAKSVLKVKKRILDAVEALGTEKVGFLKEVNRLSKKLGVDPSLLLIKFYIESGIRPWKKNDDSGASGIFQLMPKNMPDGMTSRQFRALTATQQLQHYEVYITPYIPYLKDKTGKIPIENLYILNLYPAAIVEGKHVLFARPSLAYKQNKGLDRDFDGDVDRTDIRRVINSHLEKK